MASMVTGTGHSSGELCSSPYLSIILQICMLTATYKAYLFSAGSSTSRHFDYFCCLYAVCEFDTPSAL